MTVGRVQVEEHFVERLGDRAEAHVIAHAAHALLPEQPGEVERHLVAWLARLNQSV